MGWLKPPTRVSLKIWEWYGVSLPRRGSHFWESLMKSPKNCKSQAQWCLFDPMISAYYGTLPQWEGWEQSQLELGLKEINFAYYMDPLGYI